MKVTEIVNASVSLTAAAPSTANYGVAMLLIDHADVPVHTRYRQVTKTDYATLLTASTDHVGWCANLWAQNYNPAQAYIGRWVSSATASYAYCPDATQVASVYAALTNTGQLGVLEAGGAVVDINPDFSGNVTMADVCSSIQTAMSGLVANYTCALDKLGNVTITSDNTGTSAASVTLQTPVAGTDLTGALYLGAGVSVAGVDAEALGTAASAIFARDNTPFAICQRGGSIAQTVAFSTAMNALDKICLLVNSDTDAYDSGASTDVGYQIGPDGLSHQKTWICYHEHTTDGGKATNEYPDAAICGEILPRLEGSASFANNAMIGVSDGGLNTDLTTAEPITTAQRTALEAKGYDYVIKPSTIKHFRHGKSAGGNEMRLMVAKSWLGAKVSEDVYNYLLQNEVVTFSDSDIQAIKSIIIRYADILVDRKVIEQDYTINMPAASSFTAAVKATHTMTLSNVFDATVQSAVNDMVITMSFTV